jgi:hypothetical protein
MGIWLSNWSDVQAVENEKGEKKKTRWVVTAEKVKKGMPAGEKKVDRKGVVNRIKKNLYLSFDIYHAMGFVL